MYFAVIEILYKQINATTPKNYEQTSTICWPANIFTLLTIMMFVLFVLFLVWNTILVVSTIV